MKDSRTWMQFLSFYDSPFKLFVSLTTIQSSYLLHAIILKCEDAVLTGGPEKKGNTAKRRVKKTFSSKTFTKNTPLLFYQKEKPLNKYFLVQNGTEIYVRL